MRWSASDRITAAALFLATAGFTLWQNTRVAALWDLSYLLDSAWRFSLGQVPYRDLPFAHAPLTFSVHAALIRLFGRVYYPHIACAVMESGIATALTWRVLRGLGAPQIWAAALTAPLIFLGIYGIYPHPIYDSDASLAALLALYLLQRADASSTRHSSFLAGAACLVPFFFKQNIGLAFLAAVLVYTAVGAALARNRKESLAVPEWTLAGIAIAAAIAALLLQSTVGLRNYFYWTTTFAAQRRLPGLPLLFSEYHQQSLLWSIPAALLGFALLRSTRWRTRKFFAFLLLAAPFLWTIASLAITSDADDRADQLLGLWPHLLSLGSVLALANLRPRVLHEQRLFPALLPLIVLATIYGTFLSQQLWGSTYAIWPLLMLLVWSLLNLIADVAQPVAAALCATLLTCGPIYAISLERLDYIDQDGTLTRATLPALRGMATPGPWIPQLEELIAFTDAEIPRDDGILLIPGDVPFFFSTGRTPKFPILLFDPATDPYTPQQTLEQAHAHNIRWLIVSRDTQLRASPLPNLDEIISTLKSDFKLYRTIAGYDVYRSAKGTDGLRP